MRKFATLFAMLMLFTALAFGQNRTITGTVTDESGAPVVGASVRIKGTNQGVAADNNGVFRIQAKTGDELVVTGANIDAQDVRVGTESTISIVVKRKVTTETEVVVTALGIRRRPKEVGYATTTIKSDLITNGAAPRLGQALSGKAAGLTVYNTSASVNAAPRIVLRGLRSMTGDNQALIVMDGVIVPANTLNYLNPNDVETVTLLKGGQAGTLYGPDGTNGALVITTKRGGGKPQVNFTSTTNFEQVAYLPDFQEEFGSGSGYGSTPEENYRPFENQQYGDRYDGSIRAAGRMLQDGSFQRYPYEFVPGVRNKVWNLGVSVTNDLSVSGGDANSKFYLSFQDAYIKGVVPKDQYHRNALRFNASKNFGKFRSSFDGTFAFDKADRTNTDYYFFALNSPGWIPTHKLTDWKNDPFSNPNGYFNDYYNNPWFELDNNRFLTRNNYFNGNIALGYKANSWLDFNYRIGGALTNSFQKVWRNRWDYSEYAKGNLAVKPITEDPQYNDYSYVWRARNTPIPGSVQDNTSYDFRINSLFFITVDKTFGNISTKLILGNDITDRKAKNTSIGSTSVIIPDLFNVANRAGELTGGESNTQIRRVGNFADLTVGFNDKFFVHGSYRQQLPSVFYKEGRDKKLYQYSYYGADVSAIITELIPSLKTDAFNFLKVRASYNKNGNENLGPYSLDPTYSPGAGYPYGSNVGVTVDNTYPDPSLAPEFTYSYEAGLEASFWKNRINFDFSIYKQDAENQVFNVAISSTTGYTSTLINAGEVENRGFETELKVNLVRSKNWTIDVAGNYTYNKNEVTKLFGGLTELQLNSTASTNFITATLGQPFPLLKTTYWAIDSASGSLIIDPADGWPTLGTGLKTQGTTIPRHQLGVTLKVAYKWVTLMANAEYRTGNVIYNDLGEDMAFTGSSATTTRYHRQQFIWPNSVYWDGSKYVANTNIPVANDVAAYYGWGDLGFSRGIIFNGDWFTTSGAFWKLRDISLDLAFPQKWYKGFKALKSVGLSFFGRNLFTLRPDENIYTDPEFSNTNNNSVGINTSLNTPPVKQYGATLRVAF